LLYWQFLSNVLHRGHASRIVPLAQSSENAAFLLRQAGVTAGLIHIDAAHDYAAVRRDIETYWELLQPGGYLVGDDYVPVWPDVIRATDEWAAELGLQLQLCGPKWFVQKPARPVGVETATAAQEG
ncbi:MAG TPA: class I SAM-dependent methyltransferase, partial [Stellaceae bacterium]|nr:class I SAM-dependent methyltransferase [Stellaceae bacterium]